MQRRCSVDFVRDRTLSLRVRYFTNATMLRGESPQWLFKHFEQDADLLLIDCRPFSEYAKAHIEGAINVSVSQLMLRRLKKGNISLQNFINSDAGKRKFEDRRQAERVVLYDERSCAGAMDNGVLEFLLAKLSEDNLVSYLEGGFREFEECFPHLCQCGDGQEVGSAIISLSNLSLSAPIIPSPIMFSDSNNNFADMIPPSPSANAKDLLFRAESLGPTEIVPRLYLGNKSDSTNLASLRKLKITHILNVTHDLPNEFEDLPEFQYLNLPLQDNWEGNAMDLFPQAFDFMDKALETGDSILVHCLGGISRSSTIIIAFLMLKYNYTLNEAYDFVKTKKSNIAPNFNFMGQLLDFERSRSNPQTPFSHCGSVSPGSYSSDFSASSYSSAGALDSC